MPPSRCRLLGTLPTLVRTEFGGAGSTALLPASPTEGYGSVVTGLAFLCGGLRCFLGVGHYPRYLAGKPGHRVGSSLIQVTGALWCA